MNLDAIARVYTRCVELEEKVQGHDTLGEDFAILRADLHSLLMEALRQNGIPFSDRSDAARIAFEIARLPRLA